MPVSLIKTFCWQSSSSSRVLAHRQRRPSAFLDTVACAVHAVYLFLSWQPQTQRRRRPITSVTRSVAMSLNQASLTTHAHQSLPSFAQAFSNQSLSNMGSATNALPPIHSRRDPMDEPSSSRQHPASLSRPGSDEEIARTAGRKRPHTDIVSASRDDDPCETEYVACSFAFPVC